MKIHRQAARYASLPLVSRDLSRSADDLRTGCARVASSPGGTTLPRYGGKPPWLSDVVPVLFPVSGQMAVAPGFDETDIQLLPSIHTCFATCGPSEDSDFRTAACIQSAGSTAGVGLSAVPVSPAHHPCGYQSACRETVG